MVRQRARIRFSKQGDLRLIGHRDLVRSMERLFRRAGLRLGMSQGFHPKPRMSFPSALAVGIEGLDEVMELELAQPYTAKELLARLAAHTLPGLVFRSVQVLSPESRKARLRAAWYRLPIPVPRRAATAERAERLMAMASCPVRRAAKGTQIDLRRCLEALTLQDGLLTMRLSLGGGPNAGPRDVLRALELDDLEQEGICLRRTTVELQS
jgi:radical SAM-linked protein